MAGKSQDELVARRMAMRAGGMTVEQIAEAEEKTVETIGAFFYRHDKGLNKGKQPPWKIHKGDRSDPYAKGFIRLLVRLKMHNPDKYVDVLEAAKYFREVVR